jgi:Leucine-rich repeat (LRR) protein
MKTLDLSKNFLTTLNEKIVNLESLKSLNLENNQLTAGTLMSIAQLPNLQNLSLGGNLLGKPVVSTHKSSQSSKSADPLPPTLPESLKQLKLNANFLSSVPKSITSVHLIKLEKLDLSHNHLASVPIEIANLRNLTELNLDDNVIVSLPASMETLQKLKVLSLRNNHLSAQNTNWSDNNPQPLPQKLFSDTPLIDLNLHGNPMTSTQLNSMAGYDKFLERRQKVKTSTLLGGGLINFDVCGLE